MSGWFDWLLWMRPEERVNARRLTDIRPERAVIMGESRWSLLSSVIYTIPGVIIIAVWKAGGTALCTDVSEYGGWYLVASLFA